MWHYRYISHYFSILWTTPYSQNLVLVSKLSNFSVCATPQNSYTLLKAPNVWSPICIIIPLMFIFPQGLRTATERFGPIGVNQNEVGYDWHEHYNKFCNDKTDEMRLLLAHIVLSSSELRTVPNMKQYWQCKHKTCPHKVNWLHLVVMSGYVTVPASQFTEGCQVWTKQICE